MFLSIQVMHICNQPASALLWEDGAFKMITTLVDQQLLDEFGRRLQASDIPKRWCLQWVLDNGAQNSL